MLYSVESEKFSVMAALEKFGKEGSSVALHKNLWIIFHSVYLSENGQCICLKMVNELYIWI